MAVKRNENGRIVIELHETSQPETIEYMTNSLIRIIQSMDEDFFNKDELYSVLELLSEMLPNYEQWQKILDE